MSLGIGAYKVGGAGQCFSMRRRYPWQPCERPPPNQNLLGVWKRRGQWTGVKWNLWLQQPQAPSCSSCIKKKNRQHTYQRNAAVSESNTKKRRCKPRAIQYLACMTGALWAKRGERDISRGARHERDARDEGKRKIKRLFAVHCSCCYLTRLQCQRSCG